MDLTEINKVARLENIPETRKLIDLYPTKYRIEDLNKVQIESDEKIMASCYRDQCNDSFRIIFPNRVSTFLRDNNDVFEKMKNAAKNHILEFNYFDDEYDQMYFFDTGTVNLTEINKVAQLENIPRTLKMTDVLSSGERCNIKDLNKVQVESDERIMANCYDKYDSFDIFLPTRISKFLLDNNDVYEKMKDTVKNYTLELNYIGGEYDQMYFSKMFAMDLTEINKVARLKNIPETCRLTALCEGKCYHIEDLNKVRVESGERIIVNCSDAHNSFDIFFPTRISKFLIDNNAFETMKNVVEDDILELHYIGGEFDQMYFSSSDDLDYE